MVDEEARQIRDEVLRAMAEQGDDVEAWGYEAPEAIENAEASVALPAWDRIADVAMEAQSEDAPVALSAWAGVAGAAADAATMTDEEVERAFLAAVFDDVRTQSADGALVSPSRWFEIGLVPERFTADDWEMFVYEYLEEQAAQRAEAAAAVEPAVPIRTATRTVGVPRMFRAAEPDEAGQHEHSTDQRTVEHRAPQKGTQGAAAQAAEEPTELERHDEAKTMEPERHDEEEPACDDIVALVGKHSYYLYSTERMTDAYARWAFLASEDDRVLTFVECVRDESRKYPRPMEASSLTNEPFNLTAEDIDALWQTVRDSGAYPDLDTLTASNGDVYYFSTTYLSPTYAASLAEWNSVERDMFL